MFGKDKKERKEINLEELKIQYSDYCSKITRNASDKELLVKNPDGSYPNAAIPNFSDWYQKTNDDWDKVEEMDTGNEITMCEYHASMQWIHRREAINNKIVVEKAKEEKEKEKVVFINKKLELTEKELLAEILWTLSDDAERKLKSEEKEEVRRDKATIDAYAEKLDREDQLEELKKISKIAKDENDFKKYGDGSR
jgi:hypothetical protein